MLTVVIASAPRLISSWCVDVNKAWCRTSARTCKMIVLDLIFCIIRYYFVLQIVSVYAFMILRYGCERSWIRERVAPEHIA